MLKPIASLILQHTVASSQHLTPEISLRLITPACRLWSARVEELPVPDPFWGFYWPGGQAAARYILDNPGTFRGRKVLDVGCGCGAVSIALAKVQAAKAVANDIDTNALVASKINADLNLCLNRVGIETSSKNYIGAACQEFDTILIGDMFYDEDFANTLFQWLHRLREEGKFILIGDPGRHGLTEERKRSMTQLAKYMLPENSCIENNGFRETSVWRLN